MKSFLKYPGGKYRLVSEINRALLEGDKLVEPFCGAGNVFINADYDRFLLNDINQDVIDIYRQLKHNLDPFMSEALRLFRPEMNTEKVYYTLRNEFNSLRSSVERCVLFLYLNRHGYNGLCRYNASGGFNVPFGRYASPYFPEKEMENFSRKLKKATLMCDDFGEAYRRTREGDTLYADPPYLTLSDTASFTAYSGKQFGIKEQLKLVKLTKKAKARGVRVIISNHDLPESRKLYEGAEIISLNVRRSISCKNREQAKELLAVF